MKKVLVPLWGLLVIIFLGCSKELPSKVTSFQLGPSEVMSLTRSSDGCDTMVKVMLTIQGGIPITTHTGPSRLVDNSGAEYYLFNFPDGSKGGFIMTYPDFKQNNTGSITFSFPLSQIPEEVIGVYFKTTFSIDDLPAQPISVLVRE
ncbi:MAG: hypothetical protein V1789_05485 [PVC group bacterium]